MNLDVLIEDERWEALGLVALAERAFDAVLGEVGLPADTEAVIMGCGDARIAELNTAFRDKPTPTNVLSWPSEERAAPPGQVPEKPEPDMPGMPIELGDIAIAYETCLREADEQQKSAEDHIIHLLVHGLLHLLGYDHIDDKDAALMEGLEVKILGKLRIEDPY